MDHKWRAFASCKGMPLSYFFEEYEQDRNIQLMVDKLCASCPVRVQCLDYAIETGAEGGVFGRAYFDSNRKKLKKMKRELCS